MQEYAYDEAGESAEGYLEDMSQNDKDELESLIVNWFEEKGYAPTFFAVDNIQEFVSKK